MANSSLFRIGILSTAAVAERVAEECMTLSCVSVAVIASRSITTAQDFASRHSIPNACTYDGIFDVPLDGLFIPLPTILATNWAHRAIGAGLHVLVDKPFASAADVSSLVSAARLANVAFMDGTHYVHAQRTAEAQKLVRDVLGRVRRVVATFCVDLRLRQGSTDIRMDQSLEPHGAVGDLGWYCSRAAVVFLGLEGTRIKCVTASGEWIKDAKGVIERAAGVVRFDNGAELVFTVDFACVTRQSIEVIGENGVVRLQDFVQPRTQWWRHKELYGGKVGTFDTELEVERKVTCEDEIVLPNVVEPVRVITEKSSQVANMINEFVRIARVDQGARRQWEEEALRTQEIVDAIYAECVAKNKDPECR